MSTKTDSLIPITRPYMPAQEAFMAFAQSLWDTRWLTHGGPLVRELQHRLCETLAVPYVTVFSNGHMALDCAFKALGLRDGEAITTPFTYISTVNACAMNGLKPVFCDIKPSDCTMDEAKIEALITEKTKVIVPVHVYGFPCNHQAIQRIADKHGLKVVYDAAHAFGVKVKGVGIGNLGDAAMFSFHATKVFHTVEGGAVAYKDASLAAPLDEAKNFGMVSAEEAESISFNAKMTELHAAMGLANLQILQEQIQKRRQLIEGYLDRLAQVEELELYRWDDPDVSYNYAYFPICVKPGAKVDRDGLAQVLQDRYQVQTRKYFHPLVSRYHSYQRYVPGGATPVALDISGRVLTLPLFVDLTLEQVDYICAAIRTIFAS